MNRINLKRRMLRYLEIAKRLPLKKGVVDNARGSYGALIATMNPKDFLSLTVPGVSDIKSIMDETKVGLDKYNKSDYSMPFLMVNWDTGKVLGHEGRHRAAMIIKEGGDKFPVVIYFRREFHIVNWLEITGPNDEDYITQSRKFVNKDEAFEFYWELRHKALDDQSIEDVKEDFVRETVKGSPRGSDPSRYHHVPFTKEDMPPYLICQFNDFRRVDTSYMKIGLVKGHNHFKRG